MSKEQEEFILNNYKQKTIKEMARELKCSENIIKKVFKNKNLVSPFKYENNNVNVHYSDASFTAFQFSVKRILLLGLTNPEDVFNGAIIDYCLDTYHDIRISKLIFKKYFYDTLVPNFESLLKKDICISENLIEFLKEKNHKN